MNSRGLGRVGVVSLAGSLAIAAGFFGCANKPAATTAGATAQCDLNNPAQTADAAKPAAPAKADAHGDGHALHNVHHLGGKMISGAVPEGAPAFDELRRMGVKTIISVDGATPDVQAAEARGMRYVHIPITYSQVSDGQQKEIARAVRDLPGPIYIHCHHGKHRSPAATAAVAVALGEVSNAEAIAFMKKAGTAANYTGLYACVSEAVKLDKATLDSAPADFPSVHKPAGIVAAMVEVDLAYEHLGYIKAADWKVPADHPDLVPAAEAGRLADQFRFSKEDPKARQLGDDHLKKLEKAIALASSLEEGIVRGDAPAKLNAAWNDIVASCKDCHAKYRDVRPTKK